MILLQRGSKMRTRTPDHPSPVRDMACVYDTGCGRRKMLDAKGVTTRTRARVPVKYVNTKLYKLRNEQKANPWRKYQSVFHKVRGQCKKVSRHC